MKRLELVAKPEGPTRLDRYLSEAEKLLTRSQIQRLIKSGMITVDGSETKPSHKLRGGELISVVIPEPVDSHLTPEPIPLNIVYEDSYLIVVNKPAGMVVHPGAGVRGGTLVNALLAHCKDLSGIGGVIRPGIVHRIDKGTSGLLVVAKDDRTHLLLSQALRDRQIKRIYEAVVWGKPPDRGKVETLIGRSPAQRKKMIVRRQTGRLAITGFEVIERFGFASLLRLSLETGRTHQIRVHMAHIGHPIFGDPDYGGRRRSYGDLKESAMKKARQCLALIDRQALHAKRLVFTHPVTGSKMEFEAQFPDDMKSLLSALRQMEGSAGQQESD